VILEVISSGRSGRELCGTASSSVIVPSPFKTIIFLPFPFFASARIAESSSN